MKRASTRRPSRDAERKAERLAELVAGLTGCEQTGALHAVRVHQEEDRPDLLDLVARAMIDVDAPAPEGFRVTGFLKDDDITVEVPEHTSLRRWDRLHDEVDRPEDDIFARRIEHARARFNAPADASTQLANELPRRPRAAG